MIKYIIKRLLLLIPIILGVAFIIFSIMELTPGDPAVLILGPEAEADAIAALRVELGLDQPFFVRFFDYIFKIVTQFDFGISYRSGKPVFGEILVRLPVSLKIATYSILVSTLIGVPLGVLSAVKQYSLADNIFRVTSMVMVAVPSFWMALMLIWVFALILGLLPTSGISSWQCYILPTISLSALYAGRILRITRSTMLECIRQDYIVTAKAKGLKQSVVTFKHALKNALLPVITTIATSFGGLLGGAIITESVYSMPGLGSYIVLGIKTKDTPSVMGSIVTLATCFTIIMLIVDLVYAFIDPRIKAKYMKK